jgi:hypothetical protein
MMDCKSMTTPMISNLKKLQDQVTGSDPEDPVDRPFSNGGQLHVP